MKSHGSQDVSEFQDNEVGKSSHEISPRCGLSTFGNRGAKDEDLSISKVDLKGTQLAALHSVEVQCIINVKVEEDV